jgi:hypothetical protein
MAWPHCLKRDLSALNFAAKALESLLKLFQESNRSNTSKQALNRPASPTTPTTRLTGSIVETNNLNKLQMKEKYYALTAIAATLDLSVRQAAVLPR